MIYLTQIMPVKQHKSQAKTDFSVSVKSVVFGLTILKCLTNTILKYWWDCSYVVIIWPISHSKWWYVPSSKMLTVDSLFSASWQITSEWPKIILLIASGFLSQEFRSSLTGGSGWWSLLRLHSSCQMGLHPLKAWLGLEDPLPRRSIYLVLIVGERTHFLKARSSPQTA